MTEPYKVRPVVYVRRRRPTSSTSTSAVVYAVAVVVAVALGAVFYAGYQKNERDVRGFTQQDLPGGTKVVDVGSRAPAQTSATNVPPDPSAYKEEPDVAPPPAQPVEKKPAAKSQTMQPIVVAVDTTPGAMPAIRHEPRVLWTVRPEDITNPLKGKMDPTADTAVLTTPGEQDRNGGALHELPLHGNESIVLAKFDVRSVVGWTVTRAAWHCKLQKGNLRVLSFSTIPVDWDEGEGTLIAQAPSGATYEGANAAKAPWTKNGEPLSALLRGRGNSLVCYSEPDNPDNHPGEWVSFELQPDIVQALISGAAVGLAICDEKGQLNADSAIASREDESFTHYIDVEGRSTDLTPPAQIEGLHAYAHPDLRRGKGAGALLTWIAPGDDEMQGQAFRYEVRYSATPDIALDQATPVPRESLPFPLPAGRAEQLVVDGLQAETPYTFYLRAADEAGQFGTVAKATVTTAPALDLGQSEPPKSYDGAPLELVPGQLTLQALDELSVLDPLAESAEKTSTVWDRTSRSMYLRAARNQHAGILLKFGRKAAAFPAIGIEPQPFTGPDGKPAEFQAQLFQVVFAAAPGSRPGPAFIGDALIPLSGTLEPAQGGFAWPGQKHEAVYAEIDVPATAMPGLYRSKLKLTVPQHPDINLNVFLTVDPVALGEPKFEVEFADGPSAVAQVAKKDYLNAADARAAELAYVKMAKEHRGHFVVIPYAATGDCPVPYSPRTQGAAAEWNVASWTEWDDRFSDVLAEQDHVVLPLFENWPTAFLDGYACADQEVSVAGRETKVYGGISKGVPGCLSREYWDGFGAAATAFGEHLAQTDHKDVKSHVWFATEPSTNYTGKAPPWNLAQPAFRDDFIALEAYGEKGLHRGDTGAPSRVVFRVNVPDLRALGDYGIGVFDLLSIEDTNFALWPSLKERIALTHEKIWFQSQSLPPDSGGAGLASIALNAFLDGADGWGIRGVVGQSENWKKATASSIFYAGTAVGVSTPYPSLRLKIVRALQEDIDLLIALQEKRKWTRDQLRDFASVYCPEERNTLVVTPGTLERLRDATADALAK